MIGILLPEWTPEYIHDLLVTTHAHKSKKSKENKALEKGLVLGLRNIANETIHIYLIQDDRLRFKTRSCLSKHYTAYTCYI